MRILRNPRLTATIAYLGLAAVDSYLAGRAEPRARSLRHVTKPLLMPALAARTRLATSGTEAGLVRAVRAAQLFSWGGDLALLGRGKPSFLTGVGSFMAAHVCYIAGFRSARDPDSGLSDPGPMAAAGTWLLAAPLMAVAAGRQDPTLRVPIAVYAGVLSAMFGSSTVLHRSIPRSARRRVLAGTSLFLLSDTLLAVEKFLRTEPSPALESAVMATYTAGQWLIAEGTVAAAGSG